MRAGEPIDVTFATVTPRARSSRPLISDEAVQQLAAWALAGIGWGLTLWYGTKIAVDIFAKLLGAPL